MITERTEPIIDDTITINSIKLINIMKYYKDNATSKDIKSFTIEYVKNNTNDEELIKILEGINCSLFNTHIGITCRLISRGLNLPERHTNNIEEYINTLLDKYYETTNTPKVNNKNKVTKLDKLIIILEELLLVKYKESNVLKFITDNKIKKSDCIKLVEYLNKKYSNKYENIIFILNTSEGYKITRKHKKKEIDLDKLVSKVKYCKEYKNLVSLDPKLIFNSKYILLYDIKYKTIRLLISDNKLTLRGSTIYNFNEETSICKHIKDINSFLEVVNNTNNIKFISNNINSINSKPRPINGALNDNVIIVKVI